MNVLRQEGSDLGHILTTCYFWLWGLRLKEEEFALCSGRKVEIASVISTP